MAKKIYIGVDGTSRKIKKGYIGVDGVARKIKKAYIGVGGVARPCFSGGELAYYGELTSRTIYSNDGAATAVGDYAIFAGGDMNNVYAVSGVYLSVTYTEKALYYKVEGLAATTVGNYAIFAGGYSEDSKTYRSVMNAYDRSLTRTYTEYSLVAAVSDLAATTTGNYAIFAGGYNNNIGCSGRTTYYNASLTRSIGTDMTTARSKLAATTVGNYAIFAGGKKDNAGNCVAAVEAYDKSLVHSSLSNGLSYAKEGLVAAAVGNYALFAGGADSKTTYRGVDVYDTSLIRSKTASLLSDAKWDGAATSLGDYALFAGGYKNIYTSVYNAEESATVDAYDSSLTKTTQHELSAATSWLSAASVGNYAIFAGGFNGSTEGYVTDVYMID